ncbi:MAG: DUF4249 family protein [Rhodothermales bacterium]
MKPAPANTPRLAASAILLCAVLGLTLTACDQTDIDPFHNDGQYFTVWGYLDVLEREQTIRVVPVTRFPERIESPTEPQAYIDADVYTTDLSTEERIKWTHSLMQLDDGTYGHMYTARFIVRPGRTYRLEVVRSDGKMAVAETTVPRTVDQGHMQRSEVMYNADSTEIWQDIEVRGIPSPWDMRALYTAGASTNFHVQVPYGRTGERTTDGGWRTRLHISRDQPAVQEYLRSFPDESGATLVAVGLQLRILDENWDPPEGVFDPEVLAQPGVLTNVSGGHGFFGSMGYHAEEWEIDVPQRLLGYPLVVERPPAN